MNLHIICPACQRDCFEETFYHITDENLKLTCRQCKTIVHFTTSSVIRAYFMYHTLKEGRYELAFYLIECLPLAAAGTFSLNFKRGNEAENKTLLVLPFHPKIDATNIATKLPLYLPFL